MDERQSKRVPTSFQFTQPSIKSEASANGQTPISFKFDSSTNGSSSLNNAKNPKFATFTSSAKKPTKANNFNQPNLSLIGNHVSLNEANLSMPPNSSFTFGSINNLNSKNSFTNSGFNFGSMNNRATKSSFSTNINSSFPKLQNGNAKSSSSLFNFGNLQTENTQMPPTSNISFSFRNFKNVSVNDTSSDYNYLFGNNQNNDTKSPNGASTFGTSQNQATGTLLLKNPFSTPSSVPNNSFQFSSLPTKPDNSNESESGNHINQTTQNTAIKTIETPISNFNLPALTKSPPLSNPFAPLQKVTKAPVSPITKQSVKDEAKEQPKLINTSTSLPPLNLEPHHVPLPNTDQEDDFIFYSDRIRTNMLRLGELDECSSSELSSTTAINLVKILHITRLKATMEQRYTSWYSTVEDESAQTKQFNTKSTTDLASISSTS